ncbi:hypothetical protein LY78DRAFT_657944 [Colletotrichum sublineola]|nr:hypothetical protein LY78DRAFT_657944 [Colletotrichum sublineola]
MVTATVAVGVTVKHGGSRAREVHLLVASWTAYGVSVFTTYCHSRLSSGKTAWKALLSSLFFVSPPAVSAKIPNSIRSLGRAAEPAHTATSQARA